METSDLSHSLPKVELSDKPFAYYVVRPTGFANKAEILLYVLDPSQEVPPNGVPLYTKRS